MGKKTGSMKMDNKVSMGKENRDKEKNNNTRKEKINKDNPDIYHKEINNQDNKIFKIIMLISNIKIDIINTA